MQSLTVADFWNAPTNKQSIPYEETYFAKTLALLPPVTKQGPWVAGGAVRRLFAGEHQDTDFDFFFKTMEQYNEFCGQMVERGATVDHENAFNTTFIYEGRVIQPIKVDLCNTLIQTLNRFDFTICQFGFDGANLIWGTHSWEHLLEKKLVINNHENPIFTLQRAMKYARQGFSLGAPEIKKLMGKVQKEPELLENARQSPSDPVTEAMLKAQKEGTASWNMSAPVAPDTLHMAKFELGKWDVVTHKDGGIHPNYPIGGFVRNPVPDILTPHK